MDPRPHLQSTRQNATRKLGTNTLRRKLVPTVGDGVDLYPGEARQARPSTEQKAAEEQRAKRTYYSGFMMGGCSL